MITLILAFSMAIANARGALAPYTGFVEVRPGRSLYVDLKPAAPGRPTVVLLNGLTYSTRNWDRYVDELLKIDPGLGILRYDPRGMGRTLLSDGIPLRPITLEDQSDDLHGLKPALGISGPTFALGLSYGGALALMHSVRHGEDFDQYIAMAPFLEPIPQQDAMIKEMVKSYRWNFPLDPRSDDELYDVYLWTLVYSTYPNAEPSVLEHPFKLQSIFRLAQGSRSWLAARYAALFPKGRVHVVGATADEYVGFDRLQYFLSQVPAGTLASTMFIQDPPLETLPFTQKHHKIVELRARLAAAWSYRILSGDPELQKGLTFWTDPKEGVAHGGGISLPLGARSTCAGSVLGIAPGTR